MSSERPGPFLVLAGPTGVGKTVLSLTMAKRIGAEIISADSRQVFRGMDIGTAKPSVDELKAIPHHFINERDLGNPWSAGRFAEDANIRIGSMLRRGAVPLVVGGSTLYLEALVHGLAKIPDSDPAIRAQLNEQVSMPEGAQKLFEELQRVDPEGAETLDSTKTQRLVRALEVYRATGEPWSSFFARAEPPPYRYRIVVLTRPRAGLYARIEARVDAMLDAGLLEEKRRL
ncbi:MAG: tRNA (adenosine(37)-N6)-dimethylallyltransferase MiaA, partial [Bacteroidetes bacterium]|nr:tRNA (adenosine(37)-N6)-dimethylallyltransferase MiaA [Bacteroidota bacterium]